uniref:AMP-binding enzyme C-terminal domain-containing protein n=1 Tax=Panagrolaimus superbus TaxID=310955 RepID=A0A914YY96_9BILA
MIIRGGVNLYPAEIEQYIVRHPLIADASIFGVPDEKMGEELCAWIRLKPGAKVSEEEIVEFFENGMTE